MQLISTYGRGLSDINNERDPDEKIVGYTEIPAGLPPGRKVSRVVRLRLRVSRQPGKISGIFLRIKIRASHPEKNHDFEVKSQNSLKKTKK